MACLKDLVLFSTIMERSTKDTSKMDKRKGLAMKTTLIVLTIWVTLFVAKEKERASSSGVTEKSMMESGKTTKKKVVEFGKDLITFPMSESGIMTLFKDSEF